MEGSDYRLMHRQCGDAEVTVFWQRKSGSVLGRVCRGGRIVPVAICGIPKGRAEVDELPMVKRYFEGAAVRIQERRIDVWPRLLGGAGDEDSSLHSKLKYEKLEDILLGLAGEKAEPMAYQMELDRRFERYAKWGKSRETVDLCHARTIFFALAEKSIGGNINVFIRAMNGLMDTLKNDLCEPSTSENLIKTCNGLWGRMEAFKGSSIELEKLTCAFRLALIALDKHYRAGYLVKFLPKKQEEGTEVLRIVQDFDALDVKSDLNFIKEGMKRLEATEGAQQSIVLVEKERECQRFWSEIHNVRATAPEIFEYTDPVAVFTGREEALEKIKKILTPIKDENEETKVVLLTGLAGVGKTQLARKFIADHYSNYSNVYTFDCHSAETLNRTTRIFARQLGYETKNIPMKDVFKQVIKEELEQSNRKGYLLLFDNADSPEMLKFLYDEYTFPVCGGHILITSRKAWHGNKSVEVIELKNLTSIESFALLKKVIFKNKYEDESELKKLVKKLKKVPLALLQAGGYINSSEEGYGVRQYSREFKRESGACSSGSDVDFWAQGIIAATLKKSRKYIKQVCTEADEVLNLFAFFNPEEIAVDWMATWLGENEINTNKIIKILSDDYAIITHNADKNSISIHRLIQDIIKSDLDKVNGREEESVLDVLKLLKERFSLFDYKKPHTWKNIDANCLSQANNITNYTKERYLSPFNVGTETFVTPADQIFKEVRFILNKMIMYAYLQGDIFQAKKYFKDALEIRKIFYAEDYQEISFALNELGMKLFSTLEEIKKIKKDCKKINYDYFYTNSDDKKVSTKAMLHNQIVLGVVYNDLGKYKNATETYKEMLRPYDKEIALDYLEMIGKIKSLQGRNYTDQGKYTKARGCMAAAMYILWNLYSLRTSYGNSEESEQCRLSLGEILDNLSVFSNLSKKEEEEIKVEKEVEDAIACFNDKFEQVVKSNLDDADDCRFSLIEIWNNLGLICCNSVQDRDSDKAKEYFKKAMESFQAFYGNNHPWVAVVRLNLAEAQRKLGELKEAFSLAESALVLFQQIVGGNHSQVVQALNLLGKICCDLKDFQESKKYYEQALAIIKATYRETLFSDKGETYVGLANVMRGQGELTQSLKYIEKARNSFRAVYGGKHSKVVECDHFIREIHQILGGKEEGK